MYKHVLYYFLCCIFLLLVACKPATEQPLTDSQRSDITAAVEQSFREFSNHFVQLNPDGIMQCFAAEDEIVWAIDGIIFKGFPIELNFFGSDGFCGPKK